MAATPEGSSLPQVAARSRGKDRRGRCRLLALIGLALSCCATPLLGAQAQQSETDELRQEITELQEETEDQGRELERLAGRVEGIDESARRACDSADSLISMLQFLVYLVPLVAGGLAFLGYRRLQDFVRAEIETAQTRFDALIALVEEYAEQAGENVAAMERTREAADRDAADARNRVEAVVRDAENSAKQAAASAAAAQDKARITEGQIARIEEFWRRTQQAAEALRHVRIVKKPSPEERESVQHIAIRLELGEALGMSMDAGLYFVRGNASHLSKDFYQALDYYDLAIEKTPEFPEAHLARAITLACLDRHEEALKAYDRAVELDPTAAEAHYHRGVSLSALDRHAEALGAYDRAIELNKGHVRAHSERVAAFISLERFDVRALGACEQLIRFTPQSVEARHSRGVVLIGLRRFGEAVLAFDEAIELCEMRGHKNSESALEALMRPERCERCARAHNDRGRALEALGRLDDAFEAYEKAMELDPSFAEASENRGRVRTRMEQVDDPLGAYEDEAASRYERAKELAVRGDTPKVVHHLGRAIELDGKYRDRAKADPDFDKLREDPEFRQLVGLDDESAEEEPEAE